MAESPTVPSSGGVNEFSFFKNLLSFLSAGIGADRPKEYLGAEKITADSNGEAFTLPTGTTIVRLVVDVTDNVHVAINKSGAAAVTDPLYFKGQEYWIGGGALTNLTSLKVIRAGSSDVACYAEYFKQD